MSEAQIENSAASHGLKGNAALYALYAIALAVSISVWFGILRNPLNLDETGSYWQICAGFSKIWSRQFLTFPVYPWILWLSTRIIGTSETALRIPSLLAMLGAVWLLYLAARELFDRDVAFIAAIIFCIHPIVIVASVNVRPYAFAALAINAAIYILLRLRRSNSNWLAILFGLTAACILYFQYLFAVILPALLICFFVFKRGDRKTLWRQFAFAMAAFVLASLPMISGLHYLFHTGGTHVDEASPQLGDLLWTLAPGWLPYIVLGAVLVAGIIAAIKRQQHNALNNSGNWRALFCLSLALIPILLLYGLSVGTSLHLFAPRHRLVAIPGIALCWALLINRYLTHSTRLLFGLALAATIGFQYHFTSYAGQHFVTWKYALQFAQKNASVDNAPVVICSGFIESDYTPMPPLDSVKKSSFFAPLSYYKLTVPVVPLPQHLNAEAMRLGSQFLQQATQKHERFLALQEGQPYRTLDWLTRSASAAYDVHNLGVFDTTEVLEFVSRSPQSLTPPAAHSSAQPPPHAAKAASRPSTP